MTTSVDFIFDFGSPNAYLSYKVLPALLEPLDAQMNITPCLLGGIFKATGNQSPVMAFAGIKGKLEYTRLEMQRFIQRHQLDKFRMNPHFPVNTLLMMRAAIVAEQNGQLDQYVTAGLKCMWEDGLKMDDPDVFISAMNDAGLDGAALLEGTSDPAVKQKLLDNTNAAVERGVFGIPSFFVGDDMFFGKDRLTEVAEAVSGSTAGN